MFKVEAPIDLVFVYTLMRVENSIQKGYVNGLWYPHVSPEGGTDTIAFGHKLTVAEHESRKFKFGLTYEQAVELFLLDLGVRKRQTQDAWNLRFGQHKKFHELPSKYQYVLVDLVYNVGIFNVHKNGKWKWPKLAQAILDNNDQQVYEQSVRTYKKPNGTRVYLWSRTNEICRALGLSFQEARN